MVGCCGDYAILEDVAGGEAEYADGFDADVLIGGGVYYGGIGLVGDGAGKDVGGAAAGMRYAHLREFDVLEGAVGVEGQTGELAGAEVHLDVDGGVGVLVVGSRGVVTCAGFGPVQLGGELGDVVVARV